MATAEQSASLNLVDRSTPRAAVSLATFAIVASALLIYVSQAFLATSILGIKRELQAALIIPISLAACYYIVSQPRRLINPLIAFSIVKLGTELALRGQVSYILDSLASAFALVVLVCAPARSFEIGVKFLVRFAGILALMALVQWVVLFQDPTMAKFVIEVSDDGAMLNTIENPIAMLALHGDPDYSLLGHPVVRMQSFAKEPSLNVLFFVLPACLAFLRNTRSTRLWGSIMLAFSMFSLSGSVFLSLGFSGIWFVLLRVSSIKFAVPWGMLVFMGVFLSAVKYFGLEPIMDAFTYIAQYGDFLNKGHSLTDRTGGAVLNMGAALASPFGSSTLSDIPGPWLINSALAAGWLGVLCLVWFLSKLGRQLDEFYANSPLISGRALGSLLLLGAIAMVVVFNDYQMGNFSGLILLAFIYRTIQMGNQRDEAIHRRIHT
jgi:hypothetical protein